MLKNNKNILIGMVHLPPLLGLDGFPGINECIDKALKDLDSLQNAGFDAVLLENENDKPHTENATSAQVSAITLIAWEVIKKAKVPVGVQLLLNDWKSSFDVCKAVGAVFTRLDVFVDHVTCKWRDIKPNPKEIIDYKNKIYSELNLFTDIQVKYKTMLDKNKTLEQSAKNAYRMVSTV
jgi:membrane complex biogenesis BtpA family protein